MTLNLIIMPFILTLNVNITACVLYHISSTANGRNRTIGQNEIDRCGPVLGPTSFAT